MLTLTLEYSLAPAFHHKSLATLNIYYKESKQEGNGDKKEPAELTYSKT